MLPGIRGSTTADPSGSLAARTMARAGAADQQFHTAHRRAGAAGGGGAAGHAAGAGRRRRKRR